MGSLVAYGFLAYLLTRIAPAHFPRRAAIALLAGLVLLIGFSRIYLGVHFMSDVIGGYAAGAVWLALCIILPTGRKFARTCPKPGLARGTRRHKLVHSTRQDHRRAVPVHPAEFPGREASQSTVRPAMMIAHLLLKGSSPNRSGTF
jgi:hypothetical protein